MPFARKTPSAKTPRIPAPKPTPNPAPKPLPKRASKPSITQRRRFLEALAGSCNVCASARAAGVLPAQLYRHRREDRSFAAQW